MHDVPPEVVAEAFAGGEPRQSDTPFAEPWPLEAWPSVPSRVLAGTGGPLLPWRLGSKRAATGDKRIGRLKRVFEPFALRSFASGCDCWAP